MKLKQIEINKIKPNPFQPRIKFDKESLQEMADNIEKHGMIEPIVVTEKGGNYLIVAGERRWRANKLAKKDSMYAIVKTYEKDSDIKRDSLIENEMRENLNNEEFKTFCYSLAKSLNYPVDRQLPDKLASYVLGPGPRANNSRFRRKLTDLVIVSNAPRKIQKFVDNGRLDMRTAAQIENIKDQEAKEEIIKIVENKSQHEVGVKPQVTTSAIRAEITRVTKEKKANEEIERLKQIKEEESERKKTSESRILNNITKDLGNMRDVVHRLGNSVYVISKKSFLVKISEKGRLSILDDLKPVKRELDRTQHIVNKTMELIGGM